MHFKFYHDYIATRLAIKIDRTRDRFEPVFVSAHVTDNGSWIHPPDSMVHPSYIRARSNNVAENPPTSMYGQPPRSPN